MDKRIIGFLPSAAFYVLALAAQVSGYTSPTVALILAVIATLMLLIPGCHHSRQWHRARVSEGKRGVDSWYFIALAFAVAAVAIGAGGYGVGLRSAAKAQPDPPSIVVQAPGNPTAILRRSYIGQSKILFDENLTKLSRLLNGRGVDAVRIADRFLPRFSYVNVNGFTEQQYEPFKSNPQQAIAILDEIYETIWGTILRENRDQIDDLNDVIQTGDPLTGFQSRMKQTIRYFDSFRIIYEKGDQQTNNNAAVIFSVLQEPTLKDVSSFNDWIEGCNRRIELKRKALENEK